MMFFKTGLVNVAFPMSVPKLRSMYLKWSFTSRNQNMKLVYITSETLQFETNWILKLSNCWKIEYCNVYIFKLRAFSDENTEWELLYNKLILECVFLQAVNIQCFENIFTNSIKDEMLLTDIWIVRKAHILKIQKTVLKMTV